MLFSTQHGQGKDLILIHGFCEDHRIWNALIPVLSESYRCTLIDLPGFGGSEQLPSDLRIWGERIWEALDDLNIDKCAIVGHSLGGYVALAMAEIAPDRVTGLGLFHSTAYADSEEKKNNRDKAIQHVRSFGNESFVKQLIPTLFSNPLHPACSSLLEIARGQRADAIVHALEAMRERPDRTHVLETLKAPVMILSGKDDGVLNLTDQAALAGMPSECLWRVLDGVGHMGMFEDPKASISQIQQLMD